MKKVVKDWLGSFSSADRIWLEPLLLQLPQPLMQSFAKQIRAPKQVGNVFTIQIAQPQSVVEIEDQSVQFLLGEIDSHGFD